MSGFVIHSILTPLENNLKILNAVCQMTGIVISSGTLEIIAKRESKEISFWDLPNPFDVVGMLEWIDVELIRVFYL